MKEYCVETSGYSPATTTTKPASVVTATRLKGEDIIEMRPHVVGQKPGNVVLELTPRAAETLLIIHQWIGGDPRTSRRADMDAIVVALHDAGVRMPLNYRDMVSGANDPRRRYEIGLAFA